MNSAQNDSHMGCRVSPFGHLWIKACSRLPKAFRNVLRPSSPLDTKASTVCPSLLFPTYNNNYLLLLTSTYMHTHSTQLSKNRKNPMSHALTGRQTFDLSRSLSHNHRCGRGLIAAIDLLKIVPIFANRKKFPRKEVIQPQVPLRLPCYDFTPVADPTVDGSFPCGFGHRFRVKPTPMV